MKALYQEGFVPGPLDSWESFEKRVRCVKELMETPEGFLERLKIPYETVTAITPYFLSITTKKGLPFWFGAMTWIYEHEGYQIPILELPKKKGYIPQSELIAHEYIHFLRANFHEPRFEEILAYQTSSSKWRRYLGPFFERPWESYLFLILFALLAISSFFPPILAKLLFATTALYVLLASFRLILNQWIFKKALKNLSRLYTNASELIVLFTDDEIVKTAKSSYNTIAKTSLRWKLIDLCSI